MAILPKLCSYWILLSMFISNVESYLDCKGTMTDAPYLLVTCRPVNYDDNILTRGLVSHNAWIKIVMFQDCKIFGIEHEAFYNMPALAFIHLANNRISELNYRMFEGNQELKYLNFSNNLLTVLPHRFFEQTPNLVSLDLSSNRISLQAGMFDPLRNLQILGLSNNLLIGRDLPYGIFRQNKKVIGLFLNSNDMSSAPQNLLYSFEVLEVLFLDDCNLSEVPSFVKVNNLRTLEGLTLSKNKISRLDDPLTFANLYNLITLALNENFIQYIDGNIFAQLSNLRALTLRGNKLTYLPESLFQQTTSLVQVDLSRNHISTVSINLFIGTALQNVNLAYNRITYLSDNFCHNIIKSGVILRKLHFHQNPWQCSCLKAVLDEVKTFRISYNSLAYDGRHPVCVTTNNFQCKRDPTDNSRYFDMYDNLHVQEQPSTWTDMEVNKTIHL